MLASTALVELGRHRADRLAEQLFRSTADYEAARGELEDVRTELTALQQAAAAEQGRLTLQLSQSQAELLMGKVEENKFNIDFQYPFSALQAFAFALIIFDNSSSSMTL